MLCARTPRHSRGADAPLAAGGGRCPPPVLVCPPPPEGGGGYGPSRVKPRASSVPAWARLAGPGAEACRRLVGGCYPPPPPPRPPWCAPRRFPQGRGGGFCARLIAAAATATAACTLAPGLGGGGGSHASRRGRRHVRHRVSGLQLAPGCQRWRVSALGSSFCSSFSVPGVAVSVAPSGSGPY